MQPYKGDQIWKGDSLQIAFDSGLNRKKSPDNNDYEIGCADCSGKKYIHPFIIPPECVFPSEQIKLDIAWKSGRSFYKLAIPWESLVVYNHKKADSIGISILHNNYDDSGRVNSGWNEAISKFKQPFRYGILVFDKRDIGLGGEAILDFPERSFCRETKIKGKVLVLNSNKEAVTAKVDFSLTNDKGTVFKKTYEINVDQGENTLAFEFSSNDLPYGKSTLSVKTNIPHKYQFKREFVFNRLDNEKLEKQTRLLLNKIVLRTKALTEILQKFKFSSNVPRSELVALGVVKQFTPYIVGDIKNGYQQQALYQAEWLDKISKRALERAQQNQMEMFSTPSVFPLKIAKGTFYNDKNNSVFLTGAWALSRFPQDQQEIMKLVGMNCLEPFAGYIFQMFQTEKSFPNGSSQYQNDLFQAYKKVLRPNGICQVVQLNPHIPQWAVKKYKDFAISGNHTFPADPDHPYFWRLWKAYVVGTLKAIMKEYSADDIKNIIAIEILNEPTFSSISEYTMPSLKQFLQNKYISIENLNKCWNTHYKNWSDIKSPGEISSLLGNIKVFYDWCIFNNDRFAKFYLKTIKLINDNSNGYQFRFMSKFSNENLWQSRFEYNTGHDREQLSRIMDINSCDTRIEARTDGEYSMAHWAIYCMSFDFLKSIDPDKPVFETELHNVENVAFTRPDMPEYYTGSSLWLATMFGLNGALIWDMWTNTRLITEYSGKPFRYPFGQFLTQPHCMYEFFNESAFINKYQKEIQALHNAQRPIRFLYSLDSAIYDGKKYINTIKSAYEAFFFCGIKSGFITPEMIKAGRGLDGLKLLVIPNARYIKETELNKLLKLSEKGIKLLFIGNESLTREPNGRNLKLQSLKNAVHWNLTGTEDYREKVPAIIQTSGINSKYKIDANGKSAQNLVRSEFVKYNDSTICWLINLGLHTQTIIIEDSKGRKVTGKLLHSIAGQLDGVSIKLKKYGMAIIKIKE